MNPSPYGCVCVSASFTWVGLSLSLLIYRGNKKLETPVSLNPDAPMGFVVGATRRKCSINFREWYIKICHINYNLHACSMSNNEHTCRTHALTDTLTHYRSEERHDPNCLWVLSRAKRCQALIVRTSATATSQFACQQLERMTQCWMQRSRERDVYEYTVRELEPEPENVSHSEQLAGQPIQLAALQIRKMERAHKCQIRFGVCN